MGTRQKWKEKHILFHSAGVVFYLICSFNDSIRIWITWFKILQALKTTESLWTPRKLKVEIFQRHNDCKNIFKILNASKWQTKLNLVSLRCSFTFIIPSTSSLMSSVCFMWSKAKPTRNTISKPYKHVYNHWYCQSNTIQRLALLLLGKSTNMKRFSVIENKIKY